jgi:agmatinase
VQDNAVNDLGETLRPVGSTFFGAPAIHDLDDLNADIAFLGVPYDQGTLIPMLRSGTARGPRSVREAYTRPRMTKPDGTSEGYFDIDDERTHLEGVRLADCGDVLIAGGDSELNLRRITEAARRIAETGALVASVGGDHSIAFPVGRGVVQPYEKVDIVWLDAHPDFQDEWLGSKYSHGSALRRLFELPNVGNITILGLRVVDRVAFEDMKRLGVRWATTSQIIKEGPAAVVERLVPSAKHLYVSIDIDILDSSLVPGTTLPEPAGITYRELRALLAAIARKGTIVGFDTVELSTPYDFGDTTARTVAWMMLHFLGAIVDTQSDLRPYPA